MAVTAPFISPYIFFLDFDLHYVVPSCLFYKCVKLIKCMLHLLHYNTRSTQKSPVREQNAWFDTKKPGSTQKCPVPHKNALPSMNQLTLRLSNIPLPLMWEIFFFQFYSNILFLRTNREMKMKLYWYELKISISFWKLKCNHSFLFVMAIMSAAINKCYRYERIFCQFLHFLLIALLKPDMHVRRA